MQEQFGLFGNLSSIMAQEYIDFVALMRTHFDLRCPLTIIKCGQLFNMKIWWRLKLQQ